MSLVDKIKDTITSGLVAVLGVVGCSESVSTTSQPIQIDPATASVYAVSWDWVRLFYDRPCGNDKGIGIWRASFYKGGIVREYEFGDPELRDLDVRRIRENTKDVEAYAINSSMQL